MSSIFVLSPRGHHPLTPSGKPYYESMSFGSWSGHTVLNRNSFIDWEPRTSTGAKQFVLCLNPSASDTI